MSRSHPVLRKWFYLFMAIVVLGLASVGAAIGGLIGYIETLPGIDALENYNPPEVTRYFDRSGNKQIGEDFSERRELVRLKDVPEYVQNAFIAIEDERFRSHFGIDMKGLIRAFTVNVASGQKAQ